MVVLTAGRGIDRTGVTHITVLCQHCSLGGGIRSKNCESAILKSLSAVLYCAHVQGPRPGMLIRSLVGVFIASVDSYHLFIRLPAHTKAMRD